MLAQDHVCSLEQLLAGFGKNHAPRRADKQLRAGLDFELPDLHADRRLRYVHARRAGGESARLGNCYKCFYLPDFHSQLRINEDYRMNKIF